MSKQDTHFINVFSMVIGLLVAIAIALFALARVVASQTQDKQILTEADYYKNVEERVRLFARVAVAGKDNSALAIQAPADAAPAGGAATAQLPKTGEESAARRKRATRRPGLPAWPRGRTRSISTHCRASRAAQASCPRRAAAPMYRTISSSRP